ncbi:MAG: hypothetical protein JO333_10730 [Verrucomicrobia bacterium]|nr:hypothetical protein [Verrucomicrobiota bacterium]
MKRVVLCAVFALFVAGVIWFAFFQRNHSSVSAAHLAPANSIFYVECRDFAETRKRWPDSDLSKIVAEPTVRRFFDYSARNLPDGFKTALQALLRLSPSTIFFSSYALNPEDWIFGVHCSGDLRSWETLVGNPLAAAFSSRFTALAASSDSEPMQPAKGRLFGVRTGSWVLFSLKPVYLQDAVRRSNSVNSGLDTTELFQRCRAHMPDDADFYGFASGAGLKVVQRKMDPFLPSADVSGLLFSAKFDGRRIRDTLFAYSPHRQPADDLGGDGLFLTSDNTLLYAGTTLDTVKLKTAVDSLPSRYAISATVKQYFEAVTRLGISFGELEHLVKGVELVLNENPADDSVGGAFVIEIRDPVRSGEILQTILREEFPDRYQEKQIDGSTAYLFRDRDSTSLAIGIFGQDLIATTGERAYQAACKAIEGEKVGLPDPPEPEEKGAVRQAQTLRLYVDARSLFEKSYTALRPVLILGSALVPDLERYIDAANLPDSTEISRHLSPVVLTRRVLPDGVLDESIGTLTGYELGLIGVGGVIGVSAASGRY